MDDPFDFLPEPIAPTDARSLIPDNVLDLLPEDVTEAKAAELYAYDLIAKFNAPKRLDTARGYFLSANRFLLRLAEINPTLFDEVICAYSERALIFDSKNAA